MCDVISERACFVCVLVRFDKKFILSIYVLRIYFYVYRYADVLLHDWLSTFNTQYVVYGCP